MHTLPWTVKLTWTILSLLKHTRLLHIAWILVLPVAAIRLNTVTLFHVKSFAGGFPFHSVFVEIVTEILIVRQIFYLVLEVSMGACEIR